MDDSLLPEMPTYGPGKSAGGRARADKLSSERRSEIAKGAATKRWTPVPEVLCGSPDHPLTIGDTQIECYVLEGGRRVVTQADLLQAFGRDRRARRTGGSGVPPFIQGKSLAPFLPEGLLDRAIAIPFRHPLAGRANGYDAEIIPDVCDAFLAARSAGALPSNQQPIAAQAELLVRGLARVGIIALVDEATGYQDYRARNALAKVLEKFISKEIQPWVRTFPIDYYKEIYRLWGQTWNPNDPTRHPSFIGNLTNNLVYNRLAPGVLDELKAQQEMSASGKPRHKLHQKLTPDTGYTKLQQHLSSVTTLMKVSKTKEEFYNHLNRIHPSWKGVPEGQALLDFTWD